MEVISFNMPTGPSLLGVPISDDKDVKYDSEFDYHFSGMNAEQEGEI